MGKHVDEKFLWAASLASCVAYLLLYLATWDQWMIVGSVDDLVDLIPRFKKDYAFTSRNYSAEEAMSFLVFYSNFLVISVTFHVALAFTRMIKFWRIPYQTYDQIVGPKGWLLLFGVVFFVFVVFVGPNFFKEPGEISGAKVRPGFGAKLIFTPFIMLVGNTFYVSIIVYATFLGGWAKKGC